MVGDTDGMVGEKEYGGREKERCIARNGARTKSKRIKGAGMKA